MVNIVEIYSFNLTRQLTGTAEYSVLSGVGIPTLKSETLRHRVTDCLTLRIL